MGHYCFTLILDTISVVPRRDTTAGHKHYSSTWDTAVGHCCFTVLLDTIFAVLLRDTTAGHNYFSASAGGHWALRLDTVIRRYFATLLQEHSPLERNTIALLWNTNA